MCAWPAEADPSLCVPDSSIMKVSSVQLAESDSFYGISSQGRTDTASSPFNTALTPAERGYGPQSGTCTLCSIRVRETMLKEHSNILGTTCFQSNSEAKEKINISFIVVCPLHNVFSLT